MKDVTLMSVHGELWSSGRDDPYTNYDKAKILDLYPPAYAMLWAGPEEPYKPVIAVSEVEKGRVVVVPNYFQLYEADNLLFYRNALYWLEKMELE